MNYGPCIIAKIERARALEQIDSIIEAADGLMIARGDLGVEIPIEQIALVQKKLMNKATLLGKPVITATQMLESMTTNRRPTRAEVDGCGQCHPGRHGLRHALRRIGHRHVSRGGNSHARAHRRGHGAALAALHRCRNACALAAARRRGKAHGSHRHERANHGGPGDAGSRLRAHAERRHGAQHHPVPPARLDRRRERRRRPPASDCCSPGASTQSSKRITPRTGGNTSAGGSAITGFRASLPCSPKGRRQSTPRRITAWKSLTSRP